jgi:hypothetical protein
MGVTRRKSQTGRKGQRKGTRKERNYALGPLKTAGATKGGAVEQFVGLKNTCGNDCFINSAMQMLYHLDGFREKVLAFENGTPGTKALKTIFQEMQKSGTPVVDIHTDAMAKRLWRGCLRIENLSRQEDAAEFISNCVMERSKNEGASSFINSIFFKEQLIKQCIMPNKTTYGRTIVAGDNEYKSVLDLKVPAKSVDTLFTNYFKEKIQERELRGVEYTVEEREEYVPGIGEYPAEYPPNGKRKRPTTFCRDNEIIEHYALSEIGEYLLVKLPRYTALGGKYRGVINLNKSLTIPVGDKEAVLSLEGFIVHIGPSPAGGHYIYYGKSNRSNNEWYLFNDSTVSSLTCDDSPSVKFLPKEVKPTGFVGRLRGKVSTVTEQLEDKVTNDLINKNAVLLSYKVVNYADLNQTNMVVVPDTSKRLTVNNVQKYFNNVNLDKSKLLSLGYSLENINREYSKNRNYDKALQRLQSAANAAVASPRETRKKQIAKNEAAARNLQKEQNATLAQKLQEVEQNADLVRGLQERQDALIAAKLHQKETDAALAAALAKE